MREIKFRGMSFDKGWIYGNLITGGPSTYIRESDYYNFKVKPETIGQYTGLKDKNGKKIHEGDIIEFYLHKNNGKGYEKISRTLGIVYWREQKSYDCEHNNKILQENPSAFNMPTGFEVKIIYREKENYHCGSWSYFANCEVIGNIYENPELLKEEIC